MKASRQSAPKIAGVEGNQLIMPSVLKSGTALVGAAPKESMKDHALQQGRREEVGTAGNRLWFRESLDRLQRPLDLLVR